MDDTPEEDLTTDEWRARAHAVSEALGEVFDRIHLVRIPLSSNASPDLSLFLMPHDEWARDHGSLISFDDMEEEEQKEQVYQMFNEAQNLMEMLHDNTPKAFFSYLVHCASTMQAQCDGCAEVSLSFRLDETIWERTKKWMYKLVNPSRRERAGAIITMAAPLIEDLMKRENENEALAAEEEARKSPGYKGGQPMEGTSASAN